MTSMKLLLLHPPNGIVYDGFSRASIKRLPIGITYLAAYLEEAGYEVGILDAEALEMNQEEIIKNIDSFHPNLLGITCTTPLYPVAVEITRSVKFLSTNIVTVLGGPHVSALPEESLNEPSVDFVVFGEGEESLFELVTTLEGHNNLKYIRGIGYKEGNKPIINPPRSLIDDIDRIPFPARNLVDMERYIDSIHYDKPYTLMIGGRGCPYSCIFCASCATWGRKVRVRSTGNVLREIEEVIERYGIENITFADDTFTLMKNRIVDLCRGMIERSYGINFYCSSRIDTIDEEMLGWLKKAGCKVITFGIESGEQDILTRISKGIDLEQALKAIQLTRSYGISVHTSYMIGNPGDTEERIKKTIRFALDSGSDEVQFSIFTPYPGTPIWNELKQSGRILSDRYHDYKWYYSTVANLSQVPSQQLIEYQRFAYNEFNRNRRKAI
jgi:anaerobic magnesium-protoporphyrin IX monomethyl ester cyclase